MRYFVSILMLFFFYSCARAPLKDPKQAFRLAKQQPELQDSMSWESLKDALKRTIDSYKEAVNIPEVFIFESQAITRSEYKAALDAIWKNTASIESFNQYIKNNFDFYEVYGSKDYGVVFSTGYYDPLIKGAWKKTKEYSQPIYTLPIDLVSIDLQAFDQRLPQFKLLENIDEKQSSRVFSWKGRYIEQEKKIVPYYERKDIDLVNGISPLKGSEIAWMDPIDAFFLQVQGSGIIEDSKGKRIRVGYAGQNGSAYYPIGKILLDKMPAEQITMYKLRAFLKEQTPEKRQDYFNLNPSYVFFKELKGKSLTFSGAEVTGGRTIASDQIMFPKGTLAFLEIETPVFASVDDNDPASWQKEPRWVFDQDTGGAIRGGGRIDLYFGEGNKAEQSAGVMRRDGKLWYVAPNAAFLAKLRNEISGG